MIPVENIAEPVPCPYCVNRPLMTPHCDGCKGAGRVWVVPVEPIKEPSKEPTNA